MSNRFKLARMLSFILAVVCLLSCSACRQREPFEADYTVLGVASSARYTEPSTARCPWDMTVWQERLYVGSGNYDTNMGPVDIVYYDMATATWVTEGSVPDEEVSRFAVIDGKLTAPGIDPRDDWTFGNYYVLEDNGWSVKRTVPNAKHVFDIMEYDGALFVGIGLDNAAAPDSYPVMRSTDGGESFETVPMVKEGERLRLADVSVARVYDLFRLGDTLYAAYFAYDGETVTYDLYRYTDGVLVFDNQWYGKVGQIRYFGNIVGAKFEYHNRMYLTTGYLYATENMNDFTKIMLVGVDTVYDLYEYGGLLYALGGALLEDGRYRVSVWCCEDGETFEECFYFFYSEPPLSLVCYRDHCYIGMGGIQEASDKTGTILAVEYAMR